MSKHEPTLLPCPFCGCTDIDESDEGRLVHCVDCGVQTMRDDWNRRAAPSSPPTAPEAPDSPRRGLEAEIEALRKERDYFADALHLRKAHDAKDCWYWQGDAEDHLESMGRHMTVVISAPDLKRLARASAAPEAPGADDLPVLVMRLARALRKAAPEHDLPAKAMDYLKRKGLQGSPLRAAHEAPGELPDHCAYLIRYDDADRRDELFVSTGAKAAAFARYRQISGQWNAHLFVKIASNSRDEPVPSAPRAAVAAALAAPPQAHGEAVKPLIEALTFYADREHFILSDEMAWDTVSGEPQNWWCDEAGTATVEDGSIARAALGREPPFKYRDDDTRPPVEQPEPRDEREAMILWVLTHDGEPRWHIGLYPTKEAARAQARGPRFDAAPVRVSLEA